MSIKNYGYLVYFGSSDPRKVSRLYFFEKSIDAYKQLLVIVEELSEGIDNQAYSHQCSIFMIKSRGRFSEIERHCYVPRQERFNSFYRNCKKRVAFVLREQSEGVKKFQFSDRFKLSTNDFWVLLAEDITWERTPTLTWISTDEALNHRKLIERISSITNLSTNKVSVLTQYYKKTTEGHFNLRTSKKFLVNLGDWEAVKRETFLFVGHTTRKDYGSVKSDVFDCIKYSRF